MLSAKLKTDTNSASLEREPANFWTADLAADTHEYIFMYSTSKEFIFIG